VRVVCLPAELKPRLAQVFTPGFAAPEAGIKVLPQHIWVARFRNGHRDISWVWAPVRTKAWAQTVNPFAVADIAEAGLAADSNPRH